jgi:hypothetical protein
MIALPNLFIVGAAKCATTTFRDLLANHPEIYMSPIKEPHHFCTDIRCEDFREDIRIIKCGDLSEYFSQTPLQEKHDAFIESREHYLELFRDASSEKVCGEASPSYLYSKVAARNIAREIPDAKILIFLRNPVMRAYSHYNMDIATGVPTEGSFRKALFSDFNAKDKGWGVSHLYVELGLYHDQVKRYFDVFPKKQVHVLFFEDAVQDMLKALEEISEFLNIGSFESNAAIYRSNITSIRRGAALYRFLGRSELKRIISSHIPQGIKDMFRNFVFPERRPARLKREDFEYTSQFFRDDVTKLQSILDKDLAYWLRFNSIK